MLEPEAHLARILASIRPLPAVSIATTEAHGHALADDIVAPEDLPPFANSAMDGFAVRSADTASASPDAPVTLRVIEDLPAGAEARRALHEGDAARIMTGAPVPPGADAIVPVEHTNFWDEAGRQARPARGDESLHVHHPARTGQNIRTAGESVRRGETCLMQGQRLRPQELALLVSLGVTEVRVHALPRVGVLSTGDELVDPGQTPGPGQIRDSNRLALLWSVRRLGFLAEDLGLVRDDPEALEHRILDAIPRIDVLLTSGGVSVGDRDFTRRVLTRLGEVEALQIAMKPGKPQVFGHVHGVPVFGLPGNPVSSLVVFDVFVAAALRKLAGRGDLTPPMFEAALAARVKSPAGRAEYIRVRLESGPGGWTAHPTGPQGSGILSSMTRADGYAIIPAHVASLEAGASVACRWIHAD